ncbi:MAG: TonB-dependent receptor domain-containing protein [Panacagrimonas sp.]
MKLSFKVCALALLLSASPQLIAAELYLNTFLGPNPLADLEVEVNGAIVGVTGKQGEISTELSAGRNQVRLMKRNVPLASYEFQARAGHSADLSISFVDFQTPPEITIDQYDAASGGGADGILEGYTTDAEGYALPGATVRIEELNQEFLSEDSGYYRFEVPRGVYTVSVSHPQHETATKRNVRIIANVGVAAMIALKPKSADYAGLSELIDVVEPATDTGAGSVTAQVQTQVRRPEVPSNDDRQAEAPGEAAPEDAAPAPAPVAASPRAPAASQIEEIVIVGTYKPALRSTVDIERFSVTVTDAISVEELLRFGDSDVAAALKRIVGVSVTGGKYAVVRGLDGRYISSTLNGNLMPSTDPFRRDVELDLFPSDILGGIEIQKNFSADLPGETTGGIIKMATRDAPDEYINKFSFSVGFVSDTTGEELASYEGSDSDALGFDDGLRQLPTALDAASDGGLRFTICQVADQTNCIEQDRAVALAQSLPNQWNPGTESAPPNFGLSYTLGNLFEPEIGDVGVYATASYDASSSSRQNAFVRDLETESEYSRDKTNVSLSGYFVAELAAAQGWSLQSKTMLLRNTEDTVEVENGRDTGEERDFTDVLFEWEERQFLAQQFSGTHYFFNERHELNWRAGLSQTSRDAPDRRSYTFLDDALAVSTVERSYSELTEDGIDLGLEYKVPFDVTDRVFTELTVGALANDRQRDVELVRIGVRTGSNPVSLRNDLESLLSAENFANDAFRLNSRSTLTDSYDAEQEAMAYFASVQTDVGEKWTAIIGVRQDEFSQDLVFPNSPDATADLQSNETLPSLSLIYRPVESIQLRMAYAGTVSRPNITELAPSRFFDERGREFIGCPTCEASTIDNLDLRAEYYFNDQDSFSVALFTKDIDQPLERSVADGSGSATDALTFRNNESATISGLELDLSVTFLETQAHGLSMGANMAFIESEIELDEIGQRLEIDPSRELQGQSPFLANLQISYDHFPWAQKATLLANYFDDRIDAVTRAVAPIEERGRLIVNLNYEKELFESSKISLKLKNLLDEEVEYIQGGQVIESWREGMAISLGYSLKFN